MAEKGLEKGKEILREIESPARDQPIENIRQRGPDIQNILLPLPGELLSKWNFCIEDPAECSIDQLKILQGFRVKLLESLDAVEASETGGLYINSCFIHCQSEMDMTWHRAKTPIVNDRTVSETIGDWFYERRPAKAIDCAYPCNPSCFKIGVWGTPPAH